ncbi:hypothetical protein Caci_2887 [Catenulispora acidiphila DSM 44928]|uniref:Uncharacterized protein n=1 Tax=Catenulispora acidiphila (strain DSM 44928 / JCM 14897 / NBRC 102108 / NRRL B-24433 / ID139908) TaxID=479433 RepID=C7Q2Q4_CATAD|nr:hypothetical protein [Catenulispora acidiphila]ACU71796.1 hypothetical protein Caci_2887 [Catenulispora acidiphila DSM 44928]
MQTTSLSAAIPPMSYPLRLRAAARLAWKTLRTGQYLEEAALLNGRRSGLDAGVRITMEEIVQYVPAGAR